MATPAGVRAAVLPGDLDFSAGGMDVDHLIGSFVKSVSPTGGVILQDVNGVQQTVQIAATGAADDLMETPITLPKLAAGPAGSIARIDVAAGGMGYLGPPNVRITGGGGMGASGRATISNGVVTSFILTALGSGYTSQPTASLFPSGSGATAVVTAIDGAGTVTITNGGSGYLTSQAPQIVFEGGGGTGARGAGIVDPDTGAVTGFTWGGYGTGYTGESVARVTSIGLAGTGFAATAAGRGIRAIRVTAQGSGYYANGTVVVTGGGGTGAVLVANALSTRRISRINISEVGSGYTSIPTLAIESAGEGSGAAATALLAPIDWVQVLTADQWMGKGQLYILMSNEGATTIGLINWIVPTYFLQHQIAAQTSPINLYRSSQNTVGTAGYTDASGISNSFFTFEGSFNPVYFYLAKDADNNLWAGYYHSTSPNTYRILRIGAA